MVQSGRGQSGRCLQAAEDSTSAAPLELTIELKPHRNDSSPSSAVRKGQSGRGVQAAEDSTSADESWAGAALVECSVT